MVAVVALVPHPNELHDLVIAVYGVVAALGTVNLTDAVASTTRTLCTVMDGTFRMYT